MSYVRNAWYVAGWSHDLPTQSPVPVGILGEPIVLFRSTDGAPHALEDRCVHRLAPLSLGRCEGDNLRCMYHGLLFAPDGRVVSIPGQAEIPRHARVKTYPVVDRHDWIWLWMGDAQAADPDLIPNAIGPSHPDWILGTGALDYAAEARLISENLLDFSHLGYVHARSFGVGEEWSDTPMKVERIDRGVRFQRWLTDILPPPFIPHDGSKIDGYIGYDFVIPGILTMWSGNFPVGTAEAAGFGRPDFSKATGGVAWTSQAVTPLGDKRARYFFSTGPHRAFGNEAIRDGMVAVTLQAFQEDKDMIEAQQSVIDLGPERPIMPTKHDFGSTLYTRLVQKLVAEEKAKTSVFPPLAGVVVE